MNKIKKLLSIDKYNTPSKLLYYFLSEYGNNKMRNRDKINTCDLVKAFCGSSFALIITFCFSLFGSMMFLHWMIGNIIFYQYGFVAVDGNGFLGFSFVAIWGVFAVLLTVFVAIFIEDMYEAYKLNRDEFGETVVNIKEKSIIGIWLESIRNKVCIDIDLKDFR